MQRLLVPEDMDMEVVNRPYSRANNGRGFHCMLLEKILDVYPFAEYNGYCKRV